MSVVGFDPHVRNQRNDALQDGWFVAWKPHLLDQSRPPRIGGPDFGGSEGRGMAVGNGVIAATFMLGLPVLESANKNQPQSVPLPASLRGQVPDGIKTCSRMAPCMFFETSAVEGQHWTRHYVPLPASGFSGFQPLLAADQGRAGRYAIGFLSRSGTSLKVLVTDDSGKTWSGPHTIPETAQGKDFKPWMAYGPTGVLGLIWKKERDDLPAPASASTRRPLASTGPAFDVYTAISCDGGITWFPAVRVNTKTSPSGPNGLDDLSYIALDSHYAHLVWGDRRDVTEVHNAPNGIGGLQTYYARVPFSLVSHGKPCGR